MKSFLCKVKLLGFITIDEKFQMLFYSISRDLPTSRKEELIIIPLRKKLAGKPVQNCTSKFHNKTVTKSFAPEVTHF